MPSERFFYPDLFEENAVIALDAEEHRHIKVMRIRPEEEIELINGKGELAIGVVDSIEKQKTTIILQKVTKVEKPSTKIILAQALPKQNKLDFIVEKGTELGMSELRLFPGDFSEKKELSANQLERCRHLTIAALKQCGALFLPEISLAPPLKNWQRPPCAYFGDINPKAPKLKDTFKPSQEIIFFIGPEKGFSASEEIILEKLATGISLHKNILRTETAAICALAQIDSFL